MRFVIKTKATIMVNRVQLNINTFTMRNCTKTYKANAVLCYFETDQKHTSRCITITNALKLCRFSFCLLQSIECCCCHDRPGNKQHCFESCLMYKIKMSRNYPSQLGSQKKFSLADGCVDCIMRYNTSHLKSKPHLIANEQTNSNRQSTCYAVLYRIKVSLN